VNFLSAAKISLLKKADSLLGSVLVKSLTPPTLTTSFPSVDSILVIRPGGIGDVLLLAPALNALKVRFPAASITILAERRNAGAFRLISGISQTFLYDNPRELLKVLRSRYDIVIDTEQWHRLSAIIARLISSGMKIGYDTNERSRLFTHRVSYSHDDYEAISFHNLLLPLGIDAEFDPIVPFLSLPDGINRETEALLADLKKPFITLFPGASISERRWGVSKFRKLVLRLADEGIVTVVVGGRQDRSPGDKIISGTPGVNLAGKTTLSGTASIILSSVLLVSGDSGVLHLGVGLGIPTVSIFGPGISRKWAPRGGKHTVLDKKLPCSPCTRYGYTPGCRYNVRCLEEISPEEVYEAVLETWHCNSH
jgi:ADP-heptose:LPS heptosyltransferase